MLFLEVRKKMNNQQFYIPSGGVVRINGIIEYCIKNVVEKALLCTYNFTRRN